MEKKSTASTRSLKTTSKTFVSSLVSRSTPLIVTAKSGTKTGGVAIAFPSGHLTAGAYRRPS
jgi:hypothetical protein